MASVVFNYLAGMHIARAATDAREQRKKWLTIFAVAANLALLGYYKYSNFLSRQCGAGVGIFTAAGGDCSAAGHLVFLPLRR
jgi:hypothetical protein